MKKRIKLNLRQKLQFQILFSTFLVFVVAIIYLVVSLRTKILNDSYTYINTISEKTASEVSAMMNRHLTVAKTLADVYKNYYELEMEQRNIIYKDILYNVLVNNPEYKALWVSWQLTEYDESWGHRPGRYSMVFMRKVNELEFIIDSADIQSIQYSQYHEVRETKEQSVLDPYFDRLALEKIYETSLVAPVLRNNEFAGLVGVDLELESLNRFLNEYEIPFDGHAILIASNHVVVAHPDTAIVGEPVSALLNYTTKNQEAVQKGEQFIVTDNYLYNNEQHYFCFSPVIIGSAQQKWAVLVAVPSSNVKKDANTSYIKALIVMVIGLILLMILLYFLLKKITKPVLEITSLLKDIAKGKLDKSKIKNTSSSDEIEEMYNALSTSIDALLTKAKYASLIGEGKLDTEIEMLSTEDTLGLALQQMQKSLKEAKIEEEKYNEEQRKARWTNEGLAQFADILRQNENEIHILSYEIIKNLVQYLNANMGCVYLLEQNENNEMVLNQTSTFAYDREKHLKNFFFIGESFVGAAAFEEKRIYILEVPDDYSQISTGLGKCSPKSLLFLPAKTESGLVGILEIASLNEMEDYQLEFAEKVANNYATTVLSVKIHYETEQLLSKFQEQSEMLHIKEEDMRQSMENLNISFAQNEAELKNITEITDGLKSFYIWAEYNNKGIILNTNHLYEHYFNPNNETLKQKSLPSEMEKHHKKNLSAEEVQRVLAEGKNVSNNIELYYNRKLIKILENYVPVKNEQGDIYKFIKIGFVMNIS